MGIFDWNPNGGVLREIDRMKASKLTPTSAAAAVALMERPPGNLKGSGVALDSVMDATTRMEMNEYARLAEQLGIAAPNSDIEEFKAFLAKHDIPVFNLAEVVAYMDKKAASESQHQAGWEWRPLRAKDDLRGISFGTKAQAWSNGASVHRVAGSDYYHGPHQAREESWRNGRSGETELTNVGASSPPYDRLIPLHALRKAALIDKEFKKPIGLFVSDYALAPAIMHPDPFLMAVIPNPETSKGVGRFVIDFWDEPGFGIAQMVK